MTEAVVSDLIVLPPVADDPIFCESLHESDQITRHIVDPHEFAGLYIRHRWSFALHARRFLSDDRDIDEVVQEGFLKLFLALPELETELQALAYGRRTITNLCIDRYRADQRRPRLVDLESIPASALPDEDETDPVIQAEDAAIVREALALLSPLHREALIKREVEEKPLPEIAEELDLTVEQTKHLLHRARRSLRRLLIGTHVEPGVDLDMAIVLAANRARAVRAAKPTGAAVVALIMVLAGVLGIRSGGSSPHVQGAIDVPRGLPGGVGGPPAAVPAAPLPTAVAPTPSQPSTVTKRLKRARTARPAAPSVGTAAVPPSHPATAQAPTDPASPAVLPAGNPYVVTGVDGATGAQISDEQRVLRSTGRVSSSTLRTATPRGTYALKQAYTFDGDGTLSAVQLTESVPTADGSVVESVLQGRTSSSSIAPDGSVRLVTVGTSTPADTAAVLDVTRTVTVDLVLDAERVTVVSERVHVTGGVPVVVEALPRVPLAAPVDPATAVPQAPPAPQPPAAPNPVLSPEVQESTKPADAVIDQQPATDQFPANSSAEGDDAPPLSSS